jgi:hypothetical protein
VEDGEVHNITSPLLKGHARNTSNETAPSSPPLTQPEHLHGRTLPQRLEEGPRCIAAQSAATCEGDNEE